MKKKVLLTSILTIAICLSLIAGSTFALFTSESKVNIVATSGNVEVDATVSNIDKGSSLGVMLNETAISFDDDTNVITLTNIVPGDYVEFDIVVENKSNVAVDFTTVIEKLSDNGLWEALVVEIDDTAYGGSTITSDKATLRVGDDPDTVHVRISFPEDKGNEYMNKTCEISYRIDAIQGNADGVNDEDVSTESSSTELVSND